MYEREVLRKINQVQGLRICNTLDMQHKQPVSKPAGMAATALLSGNLCCVVLCEKAAPASATSGAGTPHTWSAVLMQWGAQQVHADAQQLHSIVCHQCGVFVSCPPGQ